MAAGGCNIQFAVNPADGAIVVVEMNPRVSRSSALASKATGFAIARIGTKLALGYSLDEIPNDITKTTPASFEPVLDYVVVKVPRFAFEKFPGADPVLTTQMKSVGQTIIDAAPADIQANNNRPTSMRRAPKVSSSASTHTLREDPARSSPGLALGQPQQVGDFLRYAAPMSYPYAGGTPMGGYEAARNTMQPSMRRSVSCCSSDN